MVTVCRAASGGVPAIRSDDQQFPCLAPATSPLLDDTKFDNLRKISRSAKRHAPGVDVWLPNIPLILVTMMI
ncbi:hypothetical protein LMH87_000330 [Akanthomyces muscarius]|uniref:Uncharacterized protein n=1 Tax=Akanthomyces muscarius TaxID=2231603 RepID=A0A9W8QF85_AKAMU|nr:hypothetical protein LMH87_000330 [Akanthomyces muscarius]KAJ4155064.1 hypothetical protein LMH87_000330 [Akanthomyces muscarius]